ncbi:T9SS type A sorting domain-containing protein [bacterium]|nr:T9SS type A sorting domain-containing protein [bacterium]
MKKLIIITIALLSITSAFSQNLELLSTVGGYWGGFKEVAGNSQNAFIITQGINGMLILDISDPFNPYPAGFYDELGNMPGGIDLSGDFVYSGGCVIGVSNPGNPRFLGSCQTQAGVDETFYYEGFCYLTCEYTVEIADVSDPQAPQIVSIIEPPGAWARSTVVYNNLAYITTYTGMTIYDVSNPSNPVQLGFFPAPDVYFIDVSGNYAVIETYVEDSLKIIDISDPSDPVQAGSFYLGEDEVCGHIRSNGDYFYIALDTYGQSLYEYGILILDISDPANPVIAGNFGEKFSYLYFYDNYLYTKSGYKGFVVYEISDPVEPQEMGRYHRLGPKETIIKDDFAFVLNNIAGIQVLDVSDIYNPFEVEFYYAPGRASEMKNEGDYIYLADDEGGLRIIDISDPYNLTEAGSYYYPGIEYDCVELKDNYAITTGDKSLVILDVSNPDSVFEVNSVTLQTGSSNWELELMGDYAVLAIQDSIHILDISDPLHFNVVGSCQISITQNGLEVENSYAYINDFSPGGLSIVNLEDPTHPFEEYFILEGMMIEDLEVDGDYCYLACYYNSTFKIYDLSDPANPIEIGDYNTGGNGRAMTVIDSFAFFGTDHSLFIFDCSDYVSAGKTEEAGNPATFELLPVYPNPFNASTAISYQLLAVSYVNLTIYDVTGREVARLVDGFRPAGMHQTVFDEKDLASGIYFARLQAGDFKQTRKMVLVK